MVTLDDVLNGLKATAESTRLRLLALFTRGELTVSEVTQILRQSQPRVSRHLKLMSEAGLIERFKEGSWVFYRLSEDGAGRAIVQKLSELLPWDDATLKRDLERLDAVRKQREENAQAYFAANASEWDGIRALHIPEDQVEGALLEFVGPSQVSAYLDLGTGTGRILELVAPRASRAVGIDLNGEMLTLARARIERASLNHVQVRRGDLFELPYADDSFELITVHQVLHYLEDPSAAVAEAARVLKPGGRLVIADFAPHALEFLRDAHQHRRLGFADKEVAQWFKTAGLSLAGTRALPPRDQSGLTVMVWLAVAPAVPQRRQKTAEAA
ncbi:MAG: metalloregulator ArsR/SmtB family transcription factor [Alphaproteobacteria bacterium]|nr:metalloregulator ArsR/SmtB family transcription factor [Alphaproteobacteria bacterium]